MLDAIFSFKTLWYVLIMLYVPACISLIIIVLLQKGKGTGFAGAFGAGAGGPGADTVFGPKAGKSLPVRLTYIAATVFMVIAVTMSMISGKVNIGDSPELDDVTGDTIAAGPTFRSSLDDRGIGTGVIGQVTPDDASSSANDGETEGSEETETPDTDEEQPVETTPQQ